MSTTQLLEIAVVAAIDIAGSWWNDAPTLLAYALRNAPARRPLAVAVIERLGDLLCEGLRRPTQDWWWLFKPDTFRPPLGQGRDPHFAWLTAAIGDFWTVNPVPSAMRAAFGLAWDENSEEMTRWELTVDPAARVYEVHRPDDWSALVADHPLGDPGMESSWELPGHYNVRPLLQIPGQRATRPSMRHFVAPDWASVAERWDGVHLSWAGFLTTEGTVIDLGEGDVAMLRGWGSERTLWLNPVLSDPTPITPDPNDPPGQLHQYEGSITIDVTADERRRDQDLNYLRYMLHLD